MTEENKIYKLSPSALSLMKECPRCFWLLHNKDIKRPEGIFPSLPNGMDRILKKHFDKFMKRNELPPEIEKNREVESKNLKLFDDEILLNKWRDAKRGLWIEDEEGNVLHGGVDNVLVNKKNSKLIVLDYKTRGYPVKEDTHEPYISQLEIYNFLLRKLGYETEDFAFLLFYVPKEVLETGEVVFDTTLKVIDIDIKKAEKLWKEALELLRGKCPEKHEIEEDGTESNWKESRRCQWCELIEIKED